MIFQGKKGRPYLVLESVVIAERQHVQASLQRFSTHPPPSPAAALLIQPWIHIKKLHLSEREEVVISHSTRLFRHSCAKKNKNKMVWLFHAHVGE